MLKTDFLFVDVNCQRRFVENFGEDAIFDCGSIRENLMNLTRCAMDQKIPIASLVYGKDEKVVDSVSGEIRGFDGSLSESCIQYVFEHENLEDPVNEDLAEFIKQIEPRSIFVYGVPLENSVKAVCEKLVGMAPKVWIVADCVKAHDPDAEAEILEQIKKSGALTVNTKNLEAFVKLG